MKWGRIAQCFRYRGEPNEAIGLALASKCVTGQEKGWLFCHFPYRVGANPRVRPAVLSCQTVLSKENSSYPGAHMGAFLHNVAMHYIKRKSLLLFYNAAL